MSIDPMLHAVLQNPACDTARLVYADWLQEKGDENRAELIRVGIALAKCGPAPKLIGYGEEPPVLYSGGPGYWQFALGYDDGDIEVGDRIDLRYDNGGGIRIKRDCRVTKVVDGIVTVKKIEPWGGRELARREIELIAKFHIPGATWERGFVKSICVRLEDLESRWLIEVVYWNPIEEVRLVDISPRTSMETPRTSMEIYYWDRADFPFLPATQICYPTEEEAIKGLSRIIIRHLWSLVDGVNPSIYGRDARDS